MYFWIRENDIPIAVMEDMFKYLETSGLHTFLRFPVVSYEYELVKFYEQAIITFHMGDKEIIINAALFFRHFQVLIEMVKNKSTWDVIQLSKISKDVGSLSYVTDSKNTKMMDIVNVLAIHPKASNEELMEVKQELGVSQEVAQKNKSKRKFILASDSDKIAS